MARPRLLQSKQSAANRKSASKFAPRHLFSKRLRPRSRNRKFPAAHARPLPPACDPRGVARSAATAVPGMTLHRTVLARQASRIAERTLGARRRKLQVREQGGAISRRKSPGRNRPFTKTAEYIPAAKQNRPALSNRVAAFHK